MIIKLLDTWQKYFSELRGQNKIRNFLKTIFELYTIFLRSPPNDSIIRATQHEANRHDTKVVVNKLRANNKLS